MNTNSTPTPTLTGAPVRPLVRAWLATRRDIHVLKAPGDGVLVVHPQRGFAVRVIDARGLPVPDHVVLADLGHALDVCPDCVTRAVSADHGLSQLVYDCQERNGHVGPRTLLAWRARARYAGPEVAR